MYSLSSFDFSGNSVKRVSRWFLSNSLCNETRLKSISAAVSWRRWRRVGHSLLLQSLATSLKLHVLRQRRQRRHQNLHPCQHKCSFGGVGGRSEPFLCLLAKTRYLNHQQGRTIYMQQMFRFTPRHVNNASNRLINEEALGIHFASPRLCCCLAVSLVCLSLEVWTQCNDCRSPALFLCG